MGNAETLIQRALEADPLREPVLRSILQSAGLQNGSQGLDAGCGIGLQAILLAEAVGKQGHVTGMDIEPDLLAWGENHVRSRGLSEQISFREGDVSRLPFGADTFDWAWSADCIGYPAANLAPLLGELVRVIRRGGSLLLVGWSAQQLLPGYPLLEARLNATCSAYIPFLAEKSPQQHFARAMQAFREAGLENVEAQTFIRDIRSPLTAGERAGLISLFEMLWVEPPAGAASADWRECQRLCQPESPDLILDIPGYYGFFTYCVFRGTVVKP